MHCGALYSLLHAPCFPAAGAAANENPKDRISTWQYIPPPAAARIEAFRQGLRELGDVEGKNIVIEYRYAEGNNDRLPALAAELVRLKVDIIVSGGPAVTRPAQGSNKYNSHCHGV